MRNVTNYKRIRTKMKISYEASKQKISVLEHFIKCMIKSYKVLYFEEVKLQKEELQRHQSLSPSKVGDSEKKNRAYNALALKSSGLDTLQVRGMIALGSFFAPKLRGLAKLKAMKARICYARDKFEKYLLTDWHIGANPCSKIPLEL